MTGDEHQRSAVQIGVLRGPWRGRLPLALDRPQQCVDHGVARHVNARREHSLGHERCGRGGSRRAVNSGRQSDRAAIEFLGPGCLQVAGAQSGLDVNQRHAFVKRRQRRGYGGRRVPLRHDAVGPMALDDRLQTLQAARRELGQRLARRHGGQVHVGHDAEILQHGREQLAMLTGGADEGPGHIVAPRACEHERGHLDALRPRAQHQQWGYFGHRTLPAKKRPAARTACTGSRLQFLLRRIAKTPAANGRQCGRA